MNAIQTRVAAMTRPAATANGKGQSSMERLRALVTPLNLHIAGVAALAVVNLYLLIHLGLAWSVAHSQDADAIAQQRVQLTTAKIAALPLQGLDGKLAKSTEQAGRFYERRLPYAVSQVVRELGTLAKQGNVKLQGVQYVYTPVPEDPTLMQAQMDARLSGDYRPLVEFLNGLERDKTFFLIEGVGLTGQQSGTVNLRLRLTTYLRAPRGLEKGDAVSAADATAESAVSQAGTAAGGSTR